MPAGGGWPQELWSRAGSADAVDAIVAAEALQGAGTNVLTSAPRDLPRLVEAGSVDIRVFISAV